MLASNEMKRIPLVGAIMGSAIDLILGQRPEKSMLQAFSTNIVALSDFSTVDEVNQGSLTGLLSASALQTGGEVFGSTYGPGSIAGERDSATGALLATDPDQYQMVLSRYLETAVDNKVPNVFSAMNLAEDYEKGDGSGPFDSLLGPFKGIFGGGSKKINLVVLVLVVLIPTLVRVLVVTPWEVFGNTLARLLKDLLDAMKKFNY